MNTTIIVTAGLLLLPAIVPSARCAETVHREVIRRTLAFSAPAGSSKRLVVDNISGSINVVGTNDTEVTLVAHETIRAESEGRIGSALEKIRLEVSEEPDRILLYVDAPWRCQDGSIHDVGRDYYGYDATFDFELKVPINTDLFLKTVNDGEISVKNAQGSFRIENVNGGISAAGLAGSGEFSTVNGNIGVEFSENPAGFSSFRTVNGRLDVRFQDDLSADLRLKTFNGEVYTDFSVSSLPAVPLALPDHKRRHVYRTADSFLLRVGNGGGPTLSFDTVNGDIYILKNQRQ